jgi:shikimate kinase
MMGSGKSYWMDKLSNKLDVNGYDLDNLIESSLNKSISQIFEEYGEAHFRTAETAVLRFFGDKDDFVLSTGGGTPCFSNNMEWMNENGTTIWLNEPVDVLIERLIPEKDHRPLIAHLNDEQLKQFLERKLEERKPIYSQAKFHLQHPIAESSFATIIDQHA